MVQYMLLACMNKFHVKSKYLRHRHQFHAKKSDRSGFFPIRAIGGYILTSRDKEFFFFRHENDNVEGPKRVEKTETK